MLVLLPLFASLLSSCLAKIYTSPAQLPSTTFDYIVVGGGTAGNVVANRLSELPGAQILVLEAGPSHEGVTAIDVPLLCGNLMGSQYDWNYTTTSQTHLEGQSIEYPRGKVLGGSSAINFMIYTRTSADDYDRIAHYTGDNSWSWNKIQPYIYKHERYTAPSDGHDATGQYTPNVHGHDGPLGTSLPGYSLSFDQKVVEATREMPKEFPYNEDTNSGYPLGWGWSLSSIANGVRSSSASGYLAPKYLARPNLHVLVGAHVNTVSGPKRKGTSHIDTVKFVMKDGASKVLTVKARKEIVLSAGTINTAKLLLLSGIGPKADLRKLKIPVVVHNKNVGQNTGDHPRIAAVFKVYDNVTNDGNDDIFRNPASAMAEWEKTRTGPLVNSPVNQLGWFRVPKTMFKRYEDPSPGKNAPHYELMFSSSFLSTNYPQPATGNFITVTLSFLTPAARGWIKLASSNPLDAPLINPNLLGHPFDVYTMKEAMKKIFLFTKAKTFANYIEGPHGPLIGADQSEAALDTYVKKETSITWHSSGSAAMSPRGSKEGVVDPDLKVKGVEGLRVIDASVFPWIASAHPEAIVYIFAERAADYIKEDWKGNGSA